MLGSQQLSSHQGESSHGGSLSHRTSWHCPRILAVRRQPVQRERGSPQGGAAPLRASSLARPLAVRGSGRCCASRPSSRAPRSRRMLAALCAGRSRRSRCRDGRLRDAVRDRAARSRSTSYAAAARWAAARWAAALRRRCRRGRRHGRIGRLSRHEHSPLTLAIVSRPP